MNHFNNEPNEPTLSSSCVTTPELDAKTTINTIISNCGNGGIG